MGWRWRMRHSGSEVNATYEDLEMESKRNMLGCPWVLCTFCAVKDWFLGSIRIFLVEPGFCWTKPQFELAPWLAAEFGFSARPPSLCDRAYAPPTSYQSHRLHVWGFANCSMHGQNWCVWKQGFTSWGGSLQVQRHISIVAFIRYNAFPIIIFVSLPIHPSTYPSIHQSICLFIYLSTYLKMLISLKSVIQCFPLWRLPKMGLPPNHPF